VTEGKIASPLKSSYSMIKDVVAESPEVVRIDLTEPFAPLLSTLTIGIVSKTAATKSGDAFGSAPVCAGPYTVAKYVPDSAVWLSVNPRYYGKAPKVKELRFEVIKDENIRVMKLMKGDIDLVQNAIPPMLIDSVMKSPNLKMEADTGIVVSYLGFNLTDPILAKQKVREAIALAIDRDAVIAHRWKGLAEKANSILAPGNWAYDEGLLQYAYDPAKAAMLLDEAGFPDPDGPGPAMRFWLTWKTSTSKERIDIARMIADQLAKVGIGVKVRPYEWGTFYSGVRKGNFQMYSLSWVGAMEPDIFYNTCHSSQMPPAGLNRNRYKNSEIDALVEEGRRTMDEGKRREIYAKVQKILLDDLPFVPLWYEKNVIVYRKGLSGVHPRPDASYRSFMEIEKE
jgi:peptide/nickel transport system substrate-binding protein